MDTPPQPGIPPGWVRIRRPKKRINRDLDARVLARFEGVDELLTSVEHVVHVGLWASDPRAVVLVEGKDEIRVAVEQFIEGVELLIRGISEFGAQFHITVGVIGLVIQRPGWKRKVEDGQSVFGILALWIFKECLAHHAAKSMHIAPPVRAFAENDKPHAATIRVEEYRCESHGAGSLQN